MGKLVRPCSWPRCPNYAKRNGRCEEHQRTVERESGSAAKRGYNSPQWRRLRRMVIRRDPWCQECKKHGRITPSTDADHIIPKDKGGKDSLDNLQGLCASCHGKKTRAENT